MTSTYREGYRWYDREAQGVLHAGELPCEASDGRNGLTEAVAGWAGGSRDPEAGDWGKRGRHGLGPALCHGCGR